MVEDQLSVFADILLPTPPSYWPPPLGGYLLLLFLLGIVALLVWGVRREIKRRRPIKLARRAALEELDQIALAHQNGESTVISVAQITTLLRRSVLALYPETHYATLNGEAWFQFLDRYASSPYLTTDEGAQWLNLAYMRPESDSAQPLHHPPFETLLAYARNWISANLTGGVR